MLDPMMLYNEVRAPGGDRTRLKPVRRGPTAPSGAPLCSSLLPDIVKGSSRGFSALLLEVGTPAKPPKPVPASRSSRSRLGRWTPLCHSSSMPSGNGGSRSPWVGMHLRGTLPRPARPTSGPLDRLDGVHGLLQDLRVVDALAALSTTASGTSPRSETAWRFDPGCLYTSDLIRAGEKSPLSGEDLVVAL